MVVESITLSTFFSSTTLMPLRVRKPALPEVMGMTRATLPLRRTVRV